jgi:hypothetical protein
VLTACGNGQTRDTVPETHDVRVLDASAPSRSQDGYEYVARRPLAVIGLVGERNMDADTAHRVMDRLADSLDACVASQSQKGLPHQGAARVVAQIAPDGGIEGTKVTYDPGAGTSVIESAGVCLLSPLQMLTFAHAEGERRKFAFEALWGELVPQAH